jgi:hypothetical protein
MALAFLDQRAQEEGLNIAPLYREGVQPDPEMIEAVMHAVEFGTWAPSDKRRKTEKLSDTVREACLHRVPDNFLPPKRLLPTKSASGYELSDSAKLFWHEVADLLLWKAQREAFSDTQITALQAQSRMGIQRIYRGYARRDDHEHLYLDYDAKDTSVADLIREITELEADVRARLKKALVGIMRNKRAMEEIQNTASTHRRVVLEVVLKDQIDYLEYVRNQVEDTAQRIMLTTMLKRAIELLGMDDLDVELLSARDALAYGCDGLYKPAHEEERAKVSVPMSQYGTTHLLELDDILKTLAHEIAHHLIAKARLRKVDRGSHYDRYRVEVLPGDHLAHTGTAHLVYQALQGMHFGWKDQVGGAAPAWLVQVRAKSPRPLASKAPAPEPALRSEPQPQSQERKSWWRRWLRKLFS